MLGAFLDPLGALLDAYLDVGPAMGPALSPALSWLGPGLWGLWLLGTVRDADAADMADDAAMIAAVRAGDATAYRGLVEKYQGRLYTVIYGVVRHREDATELTQEAFVKAFRNLDAFRGDSRFYTWLYRIGMNKAIDHTRRRKRSPIQDMDEDVSLRDADRGIADANPSQSPRRALERKQLYTAIMDALDTLSEQHKEVVLLREVEGMSYKDIADTLEVAEGTVMSRLFYARKKLAAVLEERHGSLRDLL